MPNELKDSKVIILGIFSIVFFSIYSQSVHAELESLTPLELYTSSELILVGNVVSLREDSEQRETEYDIKVEQYLKNPKPYSLITVVGAGTKGAATEDDPLFDQGDRVLLYLNKYDEKYRIRPFSFKAPLTCDGHQLLQLTTIPGEPRGVSSPVRNLIHLTNTFGTQIDTFVVNEEINIDYDLFNNNPQSNSVELEIAIMTDSARVFHANQSIPLEPCTNTTISWNFTPTKTGEYTVNVTSEDISTSTDFNVRLNRAGGSLDKNTVLSPLKQFKAGSSLYDIQCRNDLLLVAKFHRDSPACIKPFSILHLLETGWGYIPRAFETETDLLDATISGGKIVGFKFDVEAASIVIHIQTTDNGTFTCTIPKVLTNTMSWYELNPSHGVLVDGYIVEFEEINGAKGTTITFPFTNGAKLIEIVGTR